MEIKVRNLNSTIVDKLNELAKKNKLSREEFLKQKLEDIAFENEISNKEVEYKNLEREVIDAISLNTKLLGAFMDEYILDGEDAYNLVVDYPNKNKELKENLNSIIDINDISTKDLLIRGVPLQVINALDEISLSRNISRNDYAVLYLKQLIHSPKLTLVDEKYNYMLEKSLGILDFNSRIFKLFYDENVINVSHFFESEEK